jgi:hypothetical protein
MNLQHIIDTVRGQPVMAIGALAVVLALLRMALIARVDRLKDRLHIAQAAAEGTVEEEERDALCPTESSDVAVIPPDSNWRALVVIPTVSPLLRTF